MLSNSPKIDEWDITFKTELKGICESTRKMIKKGELTKKNTSGLKTLAYDFYVKFKESPIKVREPNSKLDYSPDMISTSIMLPYGCMMVPYFFTEVFNEDLNFSFDEEFSQEIKWSELIGILFQKWYNRKKKLTRTIVLICKVLSRYGSEGQQYRFPITHEMIANRTRQSLSIIKMTYSTILTNSIIRDFFLINPWKIGWELYLVTYPFTHNEELVEFDEMTVALEICAGNKMFRVIRQPMPR